MLWGDWRVCVIESPRSSLDKRRFFRKPTFNSLYDPFGSPCRGQKPSLPLRKAPPFSPSLFNGLYAPFGSPSSGGQKPQRREDVTALQCCICPTCPSPAGGSLTHSQALALSKRARDVTALRCSEPLRFMVVGPSKVCAMVCGMGPPGERWIGLLKCWFCGNLLMSCRFLVIFLVVSRKKRIFATVS